MKATRFDKEELSSYKFADLRKLCRENGLKAAGKKVDLIEKLLSVAATVVSDDDHDVDDESNHGSSCLQKEWSTDSLVDKVQSLEIAEEITVDSNQENTNFEEKHLYEISSEIEERENQLEILLQKFCEPVRAISELIEGNLGALQTSRQEGQCYLQKLLAMRLSEQENKLKSLHSYELENLKEEFSLSESYLKDEIICMKNEEMNMKKKLDHLETENRSLNTKLDDAQSQNTQLTSQIDHLRGLMESKDQQLDQQAELMKAFEQNANQNSFENEFKDELTCSICQELFVYAVTLPCSHSFCEICVMQWFKTNKTCPVCRHDVKIKVVSSKVIDSVVENIIDKSDSDEKHRRTILLRERNETKRIAEADTNYHSIRSLFFKVGDIMSNSASATTANGSNQYGGVAHFNNRRRSRSQSPAATSSSNNHRSSNNSNYHNRGTYRIRCYNCGDNHHVRNCPIRFNI